MTNRSQQKKHKVAQNANRQAHVEKVLQKSNTNVDIPKENNEELEKRQESKSIVEKVEQAQKDIDLEAESDPNQSTTSGKETDRDKEEPKKYSMIDPGPLTCMTNIPGLAFDFNYGARVSVPEGNWRVRIKDRGMGVVLYDSTVSNAVVASTKKFFINFRIEVYKDSNLVLEHDLNLKGRRVLIKYPKGALGDNLAWFPYSQIFKYTHGCELYCSIEKHLSDILKPAYPDINFIEPEEKLDGVYATYHMGIFFPCSDRVNQPVDFRVVGLQKNIPYILGLKPDELRPVLLPNNKERKIKEPYVCIAAQSTSQAKYWNNPTGWLEVVKHLKSKGYRVLCIDRESVHGNGSRWNTIPYGSEDFTGLLPLQERIDLLYHADFFVGLSSGLSWLAWGVGKPIVMISGFTLPHNEFYTPYRAINYHVCNGCWNDSTVEFVHADFAWCPRNKDTDSQFECSRFITSDSVKQLIDKLMGDYNFPTKKQE